MKKWQKYNKGPLSHGMSYTRFYNIWRNMNTRCKSVRQKDFAIYSSKGIKVLWNSFEEFRDDMYESYLKHAREFEESNTSIDRIDNNGNYCKENCRWATHKEQSNNMKRNRSITYNGETLTLIQWARRLNINRKTLSYRISNWELDKAFNLPLCV